MKITYLSLIAGLGAALTLPAQLVMAQRGMHHSGHQFHQQSQHHRDRERSHTNGNMMKRERERQREKPNGAVEEQRREQRTNGAGETQTRSQERTSQPNP